MLKVDQAFVHGIGGAGQSDAVISAVVAMAHRLGLCVVAEGVETEEQERFLRAQECDVLQGFRFGRPLEPAHFEALVARSPVSDPDRTS